MRLWEEGREEKKVKGLGRGEKGEEREERMRVEDMVLRFVRGTRWWDGKARVGLGVDRMRREGEREGVVVLWRTWRIDGLRILK